MTILTVLSKAFIAALVHDHLMIADFFISNGYPFNSPSVPCPLHEFLQVVANDDSAVQIIEFLVRHGMNLNHQVSNTLLIVGSILYILFNAQSMKCV